MKVLLGISGSIAAYKAAFLTRLLVKEGLKVKIVMTSDAKAFITPLTLSTLSKHPVYSDMYNPHDGSWTNHVELSSWADVFIIAPATANTIAKMANGICDNLLLSCYLSATCPIHVAPAMDRDMYLHPSVQDNISKLEKYGHNIIPPESGELASGLIGEGRMAEPENIIAEIKKKAHAIMPLGEKEY